MDGRRINGWTKDEWMDEGLMDGQMVRKDYNILPLIFFSFSLR